MACSSLGHLLIVLEGLYRPFAPLLNSICGYDPRFACVYPRAGSRSVGRFQRVLDTAQDNPRIFLSLPVFNDEVTTKVFGHKYAGRAFLKEVEKGGLRSLGRFVCPTVVDFPGVETRRKSRGENQSARGHDAGEKESEGETEDPKGEGTKGPRGCCCFC